MAIVLRLKRPIHVTFTRDGRAREEVIRYVTVEQPHHGADRIELTDEALAEKRELAARVDNPFDTAEELAAELAGADVNEAVRVAYVAARRRAYDFLWAQAQQDDADAPPYRGPDGVYATDPALVAGWLAQSGEPVADRTPTEASMEDRGRMIDGTFFQ